MKTILILCGMGLLLLAAAVARHRPPEVDLHNLSSVPVERFELSVGDVAVASGRLASGSTDRQTVPVRREGPMRLQLRFAGGQQVQYDVGWFNPGQTDPARITILSPDSVRVNAW